MEFTGGDVYQKEFNPKIYLEYFHFGKGSVEDEFLEFILKCFCKIFTSGVLKGGTLIDIGSGPTIYQLLPACGSFENIIATDYLDKNCQEITKWVKKEPGAFDWSSVVQYVCQLEGNRETCAEKEAKLRRSIKQVLRCDVHQSNPLAPISLAQADCLLSTECLESACKDQASFQAALKNLSSLLKLGGHLVLGGVLGCTFYRLGPRKFFSMLFTEEILKNGLSTAGFAIVEFSTEPRVFKTNMEDCDFSGKYVILARKDKEV
uniref:Nicotinamide N-methyltransferase n=1 Tax=Laticauda laticaudata TaxID=8630 RepID=A0A8C5SFV2_LATLA